MFKLLIAVLILSHKLRPRDLTHPGQLKKAADFIARSWESQGLKVEYQPFHVNGSEYANVLTTARPETLNYLKMAEVVNGIAAVALHF